MIHAAAVRHDDNQQVTIRRTPMQHNMIKYRIDSMVYILDIHLLRGR